MTWPPKLPPCAMQRSDSRKPFLDRGISNKVSMKRKSENGGGEAGAFRFRGDVRVAKFDNCFSWHFITKKKNSLNHVSTPPIYDDDVKLKMVPQSSYLKLPRLLCPIKSKLIYPL